MDRVDDLGVVNPLEVDAGDPQIAMAELSLDGHQWHALVRELDSVRMPQLMRREPPADARPFRCATQLFASRGGLPAPPGGWPVDYAEQRPDRQGGANLKVRGQLIPRPPVHAYLATPPAFASAHGEGSARAVEVGLGEVECFADPQPARQSTMISARRRAPSALLLVARMTAMISSTGGGSAGNRMPLFFGGRPWW
jgi:hypothetical protein